MKKIQLKPNFINPVIRFSSTKLFTRNPDAICSHALASFYSTNVEFAK